MKDKKILMVPLDERPCNYYFPAIMPKAGYELILPPLSLMGLRKKPADTAGLAAWVTERIGGADYAILALDTLIYGGLIPSRLHHSSAAELCARADIVRAIKRRNPAVKIYAFQTIMRCPWYSLSDEEPDYYAHCGSLIHLYGKYAHKQSLGILSGTEAKEFEDIKASIDTEALADFEARRAVNIEVAKHTLDLAAEGLIDGLIVPQDDSAPYGFTAMDQLKVRSYIKDKNLTLKVPIYPAADDTGMTLLARAVNDATGRTPKVYVYYAAAGGALVTPSFEDRTVDATVKNQIRAAGCLRVYSMAECDIVLAVNIGSDMVYDESPEKCTVPYDIERSLPEYIDQLKYALSQGKVVAAADVAYPSHSDLELLGLMRDEGLLLKVHAYAGWNTASNTVGTVLCQSVLYLIGRDERGNRDFLLHRYYDDVGYCSHTRTWVDVNVLPPRGLTVFALDGVRGECTEEAKKELMRYMGEQFPELAALVTDMDVSSPWNRTFEMDFKLKTTD